MPRRVRTLIGTVVILVFVCAYALFAVAIADSRVVEAPKLVQTLVYIVLGVAWIFPLMPLIKWMEGPKESPNGT